MKRAAFIGTGNMGGALARAAVRSLGPDQVVLADRTAARAETLAAELGCAAADNAGALRQGEYIFLGVKPHLMAGLLEELAPELADCHAAGAEKVLVSMAAGKRIADLKPSLAGAGYEAPLLRIMPNTCVTIGRGMTALCAPAGTDEAHLAAVEEILAASGRVERIDEEQMDAFSAVASCGPAFVYPYLEALADGGVLSGLPRQKALTWAAQTVLGAAAMVLETGEHPGALKDAVCSPGGSTIAGVAALERGGLRAAAIGAVAAAWKRNQELGR